MMALQSILFLCYLHHGKVLALWNMSGEDLYGSLRPDKFPPSIVKSIDEFRGLNNHDDFQKLILKSTDETMNKSVGEFHGTVNNSVDEFHGSLNNTVGAFHGSVNKTVGEFHGSVNKSVDEFHGSLNKTVGEFHGSVNKTLGEFHGSVNKTVGEFHGSVNKTLGEFHGSVNKTVGEFHGSVNKTVGEFHGSVNKTVGEFHGSVNKTVGEFHGSVNKTVGEFHGPANKSVDEFRGSVNKTADEFHGSANNSVDDFHGSVNKSVGEFHGSVNKTVDEFHGSVNKTVDEFHRSGNKSVGELYGSANKSVGEFHGSVNKTVNEFHRSGNRSVSEFHGPVNKTVSELYGSGNKSVGEFHGSVNKTVGEFHGSVNKTVGEFHGPANTSVDEFRGSVNKTAGEFHGSANNSVDEFHGSVNKSVGEFHGSANKSVYEIHGSMNKSVDEFHGSVNKTVGEFHGSVNKTGGEFHGSVNKTVDEFHGSVKKSVGEFHGSVNKTVDEFHRSGNKSVSEFHGSVNKTVGEFHGSANKSVDEFLRSINKSVELYGSKGSEGFNGSLNNTTDESHGLTKSDELPGYYEYYDEMPTDPFEMIPKFNGLEDFKQHMINEGLRVSSDNISESEWVDMYDYYTSYYSYKLRRVDGEPVDYVPKRLDKAEPVNPKVMVKGLHQVIPDAITETVNNETESGHNIADFLHVTKAINNITELSNNVTECPGVSNETYDRAVLKWQYAAKTVWQYGAPILIACGTVGNALSVLVMCRKKIQQCTMSLYLLVLALVDTSVLYVGLLHLYLKELYDYDWREFSNTVCKLHMFMIYAIMQYDSWLLVSVTMERLCAVLLPHKCRTIFTKRNMVISLVILAVVIASINAHFFATYELVEISDGSPRRVCVTTTKEHWEFIHLIWPWIDFIVASLLPFLIIVLSNSAIIGRIVHSTFKRRQHLHSQNNAFSNSKMTTMTAILLTVTLVFFITTAPMAIYMIRNVSQHHQADAEQKAYLKLVWTVLSLLLYTNNVINFLLYLISGRRFRREFTKMFCRKSNSVHFIAASGPSRSRRGKPAGPEPNTSGQPGEPGIYIGPIKPPMPGRSAGSVGPNRTVRPARHIEVGGAGRRGNFGLCEPAGYTGKTGPARTSGPVESVKPAGSASSPGTAGRATLAAPLRPTEKVARTGLLTVVLHRNHVVHPSATV